MSRMMAVLLATGCLLGPGALHAERVVAAVDRFESQPLQGETVWYYNNYNGDRGAMGQEGVGGVTWQDSTVRAEVTKSGVSGAWLGVWTSLNHPIRENSFIDFQRIMGPFIQPRYQGRVVGIRLRTLGGRGTIQVELQAPDGTFQWRGSRTLTQVPQTLEFSLPASLRQIRNLNWVLTNASTGDYVVLDEVDLVLDVPDGLSIPEKAGLYAYAQLANTWSSTTGLCRDRSGYPASDFDAITATGMLAAATAQAWRLGWVSKADATALVEQITAAVLKVPRYKGVLPHFVTKGSITPGTEYSSLDGTIALLAIWESRVALGLSADQVEAALRAVDWQALLLPSGALSHGYASDGSPIIYGWQDFGGESLLINTAYTAVTGLVPTHNTSPPPWRQSFISELAFEIMPPPPTGAYGQDFRRASLQAQLNHYGSGTCFSRFGLWGVSAGEVPAPNLVDKALIYQGLGLSGTAEGDDGVGLLGFPIVAPHLAAMDSYLAPAQSAAMFKWLIDKGFETPLGHVESMMFTADDCSRVVVNPLLGSWNLALTSLGWNRLLLGSANPLYEAFMSIPALREARATLLGTDSVELDLQQPAQVTGLRLQSIQNGSALLSFRSGKDLDLDHYVVVRSTRDGFSATLPADSVGSVAPNDTTFADALNTAGTTYYRILARDRAGNLGAASAQVQAVRTVLLASGDPKPASLRFSGGVRALTVSITNTGNTAMTATVSLTGPNAASFRVTPVNTVTPAGAKRSFQVGFPGAKETGANQLATLVITTNATNRPSALSVPLVGDLAPSAPTRLAATAGTGAVDLSWRANPEADVAGYVIYRSVINGFTPGRADSVGRVAAPTVQYHSLVPAAGTYYFRIVAVDSVGQKSRPSMQVSAVVRRAKPAALPEAVALDQNYPNPFNATTLIRYQLPEAGEVSLEIFNTSGQPVRTLVSDTQEGGFYEVAWDGTDARGVPAATGIYLAVLSAGGANQIQKMLLLR